MSEKTSAKSVRWTNYAYVLALSWMLSRHYSLGKFLLILVGCGAFALVAGFLRGYMGILYDEK